MDSGRFRIVLEPRVEKQLAKLEPKMQHRIRQALRVLAGNPNPPGSKQLIGRAGYRIRVGSYRVLYDIGRDELLILVFRIDHRNKAYDS